MATYNEFKPTVATEIKEWDDTTAVIMWIIEQSKIYHLSCPKLELDEQPTQRYNRNSYETLQNQKATLTGYTKEHLKVKYAFYADVIQIKVSEPDSDDGFAEADGYEILVEKEDPVTFRMKAVERFTVKGYDRSNFDLKELIDIKPGSDSVYIKSVCEPFDQEMEMDWERIKNWLNHFGLHVESTHVSGHASGPQLKEFITTVKPKVLIPIHTENASAFSSYWSNVKCLKQFGETFTLN